MNAVLEQYKNDLKRLAPILRANVYLLENDPELTNGDLYAMENVNHRAEELIGTVDAIETTLRTLTIAQAQHATPGGDVMLDHTAAAGKSTPELLQDVARHLSGRAVIVEITEPQTRGAIGETYHDGSALKIAISPRAVADGDSYLNVFLHEVAHAKLHMSADCNTPLWRMEEEAHQQANYWTLYAKSNMNPMLYVGDGSPAARVFRARLVTLLNSREAAETVKTY